VKLRKFFRITCIVIGIIMLLPLFSACDKKDATKEQPSPTSQAEQTPTPEVTKQEDKTPITFTMYIPYKWWQRKWETTDIGKYVTEKTGVSFEFIITPVDNGGEKLDLMIASDSLPDMVLIDIGAAQRKKLEDAEMVYSIEELCNAAGSEQLKENVGKTVMEWYRNKNNGKSYVIPNFVSTEQELNNDPSVTIENRYGWSARADIYKAIGSPDTSTVEGFINALKLAKQKFPEVDGKPLIPFIFNDYQPNWHEVFDAVICGSFDASSFPNEDDAFNNFRFPFTLDKYKEAVKFVNTLIREGLAPKEYYAYKSEQVGELVASGRVFVIAGHNEGDIYKRYANLYLEKNPEAGYVGIEPPRNSKGDKPKFNAAVGLGWNTTLVSKKCKDVARAAKFITWASSEEGNSVFEWGVPGLHYTEIKDGVPVYTQEVIDARKNKYGEIFQDKMGFDCFWFFGYKGAKEKLVKAMLRDDFTKSRYAVANKYSYVVPLWQRIEGFGFEPDSPESLLEKKAYEEIRGRALPKMFLAKDDATFEKEWNDMVNKINSLPGLNNYYQEVMKRTKQKYEKYQQMMKK